MNLRPCIRRNKTGITAETPYNTGWVGAIKYVIPKTDRGFYSGCWAFEAKHYAGVLAITQHYFGNKIVDSTGGMAEPQSSAWKEKFDAWLASGEKEAAREQPRAGWDSVDEKIDPWSALYVTKDAPKSVIEAAYRVLRSMYHPDTGGDEEKSKQVNEAFQILKKQGKV